MPNNITLNAGLRLDTSHGAQNESQISPRINAVWQKRDDLSFHLGYARYFTPPALELVDTPILAKYTHTTNATEVLTNSSISAERSHYLDFGLTKQLTPTISLEWDNYLKKATHLLDEGQFGQAVVFNAFNYTYGEIYGSEISLNYTTKKITAYLNAAEGRAYVFRVVQGVAVQPEPEVEKTEVAVVKETSESKPSEEVVNKDQAEVVEHKPEHKKVHEQKPSGKKLPEGQALIDAIKPHMRRNRVGPGWGGSFQFLARAFRCKEADIFEAVKGLNLVPAQSADTPPVEVEMDGHLWWLSKDQRGGTWINAKEGVKAPAGTEAPQEVKPSVESEKPSDVPSTAVLSGLRLLFKVTKTGSYSGELGRLAQSLSKSPDELINALSNVGLNLPQKAKEKPVFIEHAGEIFWINKNAKGEFWLNAKAIKTKKQSASATTSKATQATSKTKKTKTTKRSKA